MKTGQLKSMNNNNNERGIALVFALLGILLLSMLAAALMFVTSTEAYASFNFKKQKQAQYAAMAGVQRTLDWFRQSYGPWINPESGGTGTPAIGGTPSTTPVASSVYTWSVRPPTLSGGGEVWLMNPSTSANYPDSTKITEFAALNSSNQSLDLRNASASYSILEAKMLSHERFKDILGNANNRVVERWQVRVRGSVANPVGPATQVEETAIVQNVFLPLWSEAIRARCDVRINGNLTTDSYNSAMAPYTTTSYTGPNAGASVATNSFVDVNGSSGQINGNLYYQTTPDTGCSQAGIDVPNGVVQGDTEVAPPMPFYPIPTFPTGNNTDLCGMGSPFRGGVSPNIRYSFPPNNPLLFPSYNRCAVTGGTVRLLLTPGIGVANFYFYGIDIGGSATMMLWNTFTDAPCNWVSDNALTPPMPCPPVRLFVSNLFELGGNGLVGMDPPTNFTLFYSGTNEVFIGGGPVFYGSIYAPNATVNLAGTTDLYGAVTGLNVTSSGDVSVHYDLAMKNQFGWATAFRVASQSRNIF